MDTEKELKAIRYLLNDLILSVYNLSIAVNDLTPDKRKRKLIDPNADGNTIGFDLFSIKKETYDDMVNTYGIDVVNSACVKLDEFIKVNQYTPYGAPSHALRRKFIKEVLYERDSKSLWRIDDKRV